MDQNHLHADKLQQDNVLHDLLTQLVADHGVAAVFDHDDPAVILLYIGQGLGEHLGPLGVGKALCVFHVR